MPSFEKEPGKAGIQWQRRPEKKWLAQLLADKHVVGTLLEFLKTTEVGSRERAAERETERQQRGDQEGKDQLGDV